MIIILSTCTLVSLQVKATNTRKKCVIRYEPLLWGADGQFLPNFQRVLVSPARWYQRPAACMRAPWFPGNTEARNCSLATGEPLLWISVSHLTDGFPPGCDALCSPSFYFSTKLSLNVNITCPFLSINERISSQICVWINGSMVESTWVNIPMVSPRNQDLPLILVFPLWWCVWWRLCFVLLFATNFWLCYFTPLFNYDSWFYPSWWVVGAHQLQWEGGGCKIMVTWEVNWFVNQSRLRVKSVGIVEKGRLNWNQGNQ